jgi:hypothetical protein
MIKEFVPYELALELKQLGFDEPCVGYYHLNEGYTKGYAFCYFNEPKRYESDSAVLTPTFSQAFRWFRENGKVAEVFSQILPSNKYKWGYKIQGVEGITDGFLTYEEAELACLTKLIEIVEQTKN